MRVGIAGAGMIVPTFLDAAALVDEMEIYAVFARREEVRKEFCERYRIPVGYDSYDKLLADSKVDVVYVALPNNLHFSFTKEALKAGKHVILEKPFMRKQRRLQNWHGKRSCIFLRLLPINTIPIMTK